MNSKSKMSFKKQLNRQPIQLMCNFVNSCDCFPQKIQMGLSIPPFLLTNQKVTDEIRWYLMQNLGTIHRASCGVPELVPDGGATH